MLVERRSMMEVEIEIRRKQAKFLREKEESSKAGWVSAEGKNDDVRWAKHYWSHKYINLEKAQAGRMETYIYFQIINPSQQD
jgi:hypothetical protein